MTDKTLGACQCHEEHAPTYWKGVVREYKDALEKAESRPLTPDAIEVALRDCMPGVALYRLSGTQVMRLAEDMHAALTEPPKRPEGAEGLETVIGLNAGKWTNGAEDVRALADLLASKGVRATEAE